MEEPEEPANFLFFFFFTTLFKPSQYIPSSIPVCWLSHCTAVRLDLRLLLSSSAFTLCVLQGWKEGEGEGGVRSKAASSSHLPSLSLSLSLSLYAELSTIRRSLPFLLRFRRANLSPEAKWHGENYFLYSFKETR